MPTPFIADRRSTQHNLASHLPDHIVRGLQHYASRSGPTDGLRSSWSDPDLQSHRTAEFVDLPRDNLSYDLALFLRLTGPPMANDSINSRPISHRKEKLTKALSWKTLRALTGRDPTKVAIRRLHEETKETTIDPSYDSDDGKSMVLPTVHQHLEGVPSQVTEDASSYRGVEPGVLDSKYSSTSSSKRTSSRELVYPWPTDFFNNHKFQSFQPWKGFDNAERNPNYSTSDSPCAMEQKSVAYTGKAKYHCASSAVPASRTWSVVPEPNLISAGLEALEDKSSERRDSVLNTGAKTRSRFGSIDATLHRAEQIQLPDNTYSARCQSRSLSDDAVRISPSTASMDRSPDMPHQLTRSARSAQEAECERCRAEMKEECINTVRRATARRQEKSETTFCDHDRICRSMCQGRSAVYCTRQSATDARRKHVEPADNTDLVTSSNAPGPEPGVEDRAESKRLNQSYVHSTPRAIHAILPPGMEPEATTSGIQRATATGKICQVRPQELSRRPKVLAYGFPLPPTRCQHVAADGSETPVNTSRSNTRYMHDMSVISPPTQSLPSTPMTQDHPSSPFRQPTRVHREVRTRSSRCNDRSVLSPKPVAPSSKDGHVDLIQYRLDRLETENKRLSATLVQVIMKNRSLEDKMSQIYA